MMEYSCEICNESFHDEILLNCHNALYHEDGSSNDSQDEEEEVTVQPRPSVIQYAPARNENRLSIQLQAEAFPNSSVRQYVILNNQLNLDTTFANVENELSVRGFVCRTRTLLATSNRLNILNECIQELILKILEHEA